MAEMVGLDLELDEFHEVLNKVRDVALAYRQDVSALRVAPELNVKELRRAIAEIDFTAGIDWRQLVDWVDEHMRRDQLHTSHPAYFGLFNPAPLPLGIAADVLTAAYNPQLAAWSHSPFAVEIELRLIREFSEAFGFDVDEADGTLCTGGAEANHTALLCSLTSMFPSYATEGARSLHFQPAVYVSPSAHHSWVKAARACGIGSYAIRESPIDSQHRLDPQGLYTLIAKDRQHGIRPVLICATAGTTSAGIIDPIRQTSAIAQNEGAWFHIDAAWGGAVRLAPDFRHWLDGTELADSFTIDPHKFLSIPMGAGVFVTRRKDALSRAFHISTGYMPREAAGLPVIEPYAHSMQWSRRFIGLKVFLPLAAAGWTGVAKTIVHQCQLGDTLRKMLVADGWTLLNETPLPVICFRSADDPTGRMSEQIVSHVIQQGQAWISSVSFGVPALRACITNLRTSEDDLTMLIKSLSNARSQLTVT